MKITIREPDDFHVHFREGDALEEVAPYTAASFRRALVMPNTTKPILTASDAVAYRTEIKQAVPELEPLLTIKLVASTTPDIIREAKDAGVVAAKFYPEGVTTNSADGVRDIRSLASALGAMEAAGMVLCLHGETPGVFCLDRELVFLNDLQVVATQFPDLRIVLEHVTTEAACGIVRLLPNVAATITAHHLILTLDDVVGDRLQPHHFCKPLPKRRSDLDALRVAATSGDPKFFFGSDSAPHRVNAKECSSGCAGVFSALVAMEVLAQVFEEEGALSKLESFTSEFGAKFYGLSLNDGELTLVREPWIVPLTLNGDHYVPFMAGSTLSWEVVSW